MFKCLASCRVWLRDKSTSRPIWHPFVAQTLHAAATPEAAQLRNTYSCCCATRIHAATRKLAEAPGARKMRFHSKVHGLPNDDLRDECRKLRQKITGAKCDLQERLCCAEQMSRRRKDAILDLLPFDKPASNVKTY